MSLIPLTAHARGVTTRGLEYPLEDGVLHFGPTLGISNRLYSEEGMVALREGLLLVVHETGGGTATAAAVAPHAERDAVSEGSKSNTIHTEPDE